MQRSRLLSLSLAAVLGLCAVPAVAQTTLDFEGIGSYNFVPANYGGFSWTNFGVVQEGTNFANQCAVSGVACLFNGIPFPTPVGSTQNLMDGGAASFGRSESFNFHSLYMQSWATDAAWYPSPLGVLVQGWLGSTLRYTSQLSLDATMRPYDFNFLNVDNVTFTPQPKASHEWFLADNLTTSTPEPASLLLLGTGLFGVAGVALRRRKKDAPLSN